MVFLTQFWKTVNQIAPALAAIYQRSLDTGELPSDWLGANIVRAFKKGDCHAPENYRPISLTSVPCKVLEHICRNMLSHLENNNILTNLNHGFRKGYSCETQLLTTILMTFVYIIRYKQTSRHSHTRFLKSIRHCTTWQTTTQTEPLWYYETSTSG